MRNPDLGTGWMNQPVHKQHVDVAFDQLIEQMGLEDAKKYMCPISNGNPLNCLDCKGFPTCGVGQHVVRLTDEMTRSFTPERRTELSGQKQLQVGLEKDQREFRKACESGNAWNYLMTTYHMSEGSAKEKIIYWINHYRGIANEFGGRKQILVKPKIVTIQSVPATEQVPDGEQKVPDPMDERKQFYDMQKEKARERADALYAKDNPLQWLMDNEGMSKEKAMAKLYNLAYRYPDLKQRYEDIKCNYLGKNTNSNRIRIGGLRGKYRCKAAMEFGDPIQFLLNSGLDKTESLQLIARWKKTYPDLMEGYENPNEYKRGVAGGRAVREKAVANFLECMEQDDPAEYYAKKRGITVIDATHYLRRCLRKYDRMDLADRLIKHKRQPKQEPDDEISLEEFLSEFGNDMPEADDLAENHGIGTDDDAMRSGIASMAIKLDHERQMLVKQIREMKQKINEANIRLETIERQLEGLNQAIMAFGGQQIVFEKRMMA